MRGRLGDGQVSQRLTAESGRIQLDDGIGTDDAADRSNGGGLDGVAVAFIAFAFLGPLELKVFKSFTVFDFLIGAFFLVVAGSLPRRFVRPAYAFLLAALASAFRATEPVEALTQTSQFAFIFLVVVPVTIAAVRSRRAVELSLLAFIAASLVGVVYSFVVQEPSGGGRIETFYSENANRLGYPTAYLSPFLIYFLARRWRPGRRLSTAVLAGVVGYLMLWALAASASRGATIGTVVAVVTYLVFRPSSDGRRRWPRRLVVTAAALGALTFVVFETDYFPATLKERVTGSLPVESEGEVEDNRITLSMAGLRAFGESPLLGTGLDNFRYVADRYGALSNQAPHNVWVQHLAQTGLVGAAAMVLITLRWFGMLYGARASAPSRAYRELLWAFVAAYAALMAITMTIPMIIQRHYWVLFGLGIALALGVADEADEAEPGATPDAEPRAGTAPA